MANKPAVLFVYYAGLAKRILGCFFLTAYFVLHLQRAADSVGVVALSSSWCAAQLQRST